jgi:hypothetical protein
MDLGRLARPRQPLHDMQDEPGHGLVGTVNLLTLRPLR